MYSHAMHYSNAVCRRKARFTNKVECVAFFLHSNMLALPLCYRLFLTDLKKIVLWTFDMLHCGFFFFNKSEIN